MKNKIINTHCFIS